MSEKKSKKKEIPPERQCNFCKNQARDIVILEDFHTVRCCHECIGLYYVHHYANITSIRTIADDKELLSKMAKRDVKIRQG